MTPPPVQYRGPRWKAWLGLFLVIPLAAMTGAVAYGLYRHIVTGELSTVAYSYNSRSRTVVFDDSPLSFVFFFVLHAVFALMLIGVTVVVARLSIRRLRAP